jgi:hypothetical protein
MPKPDKSKKYEFSLAATESFFAVTRKMTFSVDSLDAHEQSIHAYYSDKLDDSVYQRSVAFGKLIAAAILRRAATDNYQKSRGKAKYIGSNLPGRWRPTPPDYFDGIEYCWGDIKSFMPEMSASFTLPPPPEFSEDTNSVFIKATRQVYEINRNLTEEQKEIAQYWDDNPSVMEHSGHLMFVNKKITPAGHWMGITEIACRKENADAVRSAQAYALTAIAMFESFICCWREKYLTNVVRPVTVINEMFDPGWTPYLQTPPFPEYPSGHSSITRAAATILTHLFGNNFEFLDTSNLEYLGMKRNFKSFVQAADEASISRVYGGIHYMHSVMAGADQGSKVGENILRNLKL